MSRMELEALKNVDVQSVDRSDLIDIREMEIDNNLSVMEKITQFVEKVKNPYCFKVGDVVVKVAFSKDGPSFEEQFERMLERLN